jgi:hypothetical protein
MDWVIIAAVIVAAIIIIIVAYKLLKLTIKLAVWFIVNALGGLFILLLSNFIFNMNIPYDLPIMLICIIGGVPGAICVDILALIGTYL